jgi:hypothetical protein
VLVIKSFFCDILGLISVLNFDLIENDGCKVINCHGILLVSTDYFINVV